MRCKYCNGRLADHDLWCVECGRQTPMVGNDLSAMRSLKATYIEFRKQMSQSLPGAAFSVLLGLLPIVVLIYLFSGIISIDSSTALGLLKSLGVKIITFSVVAPFVLILFRAAASTPGYALSLKSVTTAMRGYHRYLAFSLANALYFALIYLICFGLPNFAALPILRLVWIVLVNYWVAIALPALVLMEDLSLCPGPAIKKSYRHFHDVRWNIYLMALVLAVINLVALAFFWLLLIPSVFALAFSVFAVRDYTRKMIEFELLEYRR